MEYKVVGHKAIKKENLDPNQYTLSLIKEGFRAGLLDRQEIYAVQEQVMLILKDLIMLYTKGESASVRTETAESLLNSVYYSIDACLSSMEAPEEGVAALKSESIAAIYDRGVRLVEKVFAEARQLCRDIVKGRLDVPLEVYITSVTEALPAFFESYSIMFGAHDTSCSLDYPLLFDDMSVRGVFYIKNYLEHLDMETRFCKLFNIRDIHKILAVYGRTCKIDYKESPVNLFEILLNNSIFSVLSGNSAKELMITGTQYDILLRRFADMDHLQLSDTLHAAAGRLAADLCICSPELKEYIRRHISGFALRILNAVKSDSLSNMVMVDSEGRSGGSGNVSVESERLSDSDFRHLVQKITNSAGTADKVNIIKAGVRSLEDFIDILNADCLYGDELEAVFAALGDMELAVLGKAVENYASGTMWEEAYISFMQKRNIF